MSSLFNLPTSDSIPDPSSATDRITLEEVAPRSSSLDGAVTIEFTSSPSRWYSPSDSYLVIGCDVFSTLHTPANVGTGFTSSAFSLFPACTHADCSSNYKMEESPAKPEERPIGEAGRPQDASPSPKTIA